MLRAALRLRGRLVRWLPPRKRPHFFTDNRAIGPSDFDTATITAPSNPLLPNGGGYPVTFVTRNTRTALGATDNYYTFASDFGDTTTYWTGFDFLVNARTRNGEVINTRCFTVD